MSTRQAVEQPAGAAERGAATLAHYWHPIARSEEVVDQPRGFVLLDEPIVAFRDADGVAAFKDLCIHRGTALSLGWITEGRLTCAYHGWQYDRTGRCVHIPALGPGASIPAKARAIAYRAEERYGLVWVAMAEPVAPVPAFPFDEWEDPAYRGFFCSHLVWKTSAGRAVENFMDFSHFPFVHDGLLGSRDRTLVPPHEITETEYGVTYYLEQEQPSALHSRPGEVVRWEYYLYTPFTIHLRKVTPGGQATLISMAAAPTSARLTNLYLWILRNYDLDAVDESFREFTETIMEQDRAIVESQRPEEIPLDLREELHLKVPDASGIAYRRLLGRIAGSSDFMP